MSDFQGNFLRSETNQQNSFDNKDENSIQIYVQNINVKPNHIRTPKKTFFQDNSGRLYYLQRENSRLRKRNQQLYTKLQIFTQKLDKQLQKRTTSQTKRQRSPIRNDQSIQLTNAYKKIQIYRKQILTLKNKLLTEQTQNKLNQYQHKLKQYINQNQQLRKQIKINNKIIKQQQKGLIDIGAEGFIKINTQNSKNKEQIRKLIIQIDQLKRKNNQNYNNNENNKTIQRNDQKIKTIKNQNRKKANSSFRMRTQPKIKKSLQTIQASKQIQQKTNIQKLQEKIKKSNLQKNRQRQIIQNLKTQISQKDKQIIYHKEKIDNLRVNIKLLKKKSQSNNKTLQQSNQINQNQKNINQQKPPQTINDQKKPPQPSTCCPDQYIKENFKNTIKQQNKIKYPRLEQEGLKHQSNNKWNHHQFSSKIKQIQVYYHQLGFIYNIHVSYEKGQPAKVPNLDKKAFDRLQCSENDYIQEIEGNFKEGYLHSLIVRTKNNKIMCFGKNDSQNIGSFFKFNISQFEYPCAIFGEKDKDGIRRLGCFINKNV